MSHRQRLSLAVAAALSLLGALPAAAQNQHDMTFHTVPPCTVVDTRVVGGVFAAGETRTYNVVGSGSFAGQGGSSTGCGVPGFSNGISQVQAVALNIVAVSPAGVGNVVANAADQALAGSVLNFTGGQNVANTAPVAVAQASGVGDFKIQANVSSTHIVIRVFGYYSKPVQTVWVHPVPGDATASGTALINAVNGITNAAATKRYVVKIEPGIYDLGTTTLNMKPYVDIEGSGQQATIIQGPGSQDPAVAVVAGAASAELRDLQVKSAASATDAVAVPIFISAADTRIRRVTVTASGPNNVSLWGIRVLSSATPEISDSTVNLDGGGIAQGIVSKLAGTATKIHNVHVTVANATSTAYGLFAPTAGSFPEIEDVHVEVSGGGLNYGFYQDNTSHSPARISHSTIHASSYGIYGEGSSGLTVDHSEITGAIPVYSFNAKIGGSKLDGGSVYGTVTCAGVWDGSYTFYASTCP